MYDIKAYAVRKNSVISVTVTGNLPDSCYEAKIVDKYPGGDIVYVKDPGSAQVFIEETMRSRSEICLMGTLKNRCFHQPGESKPLIINMRPWRKLYFSKCPYVSHPMGGSCKNPY